MQEESVVSKRSVLSMLSAGMILAMVMILPATACIVVQSPSTAGQPAGQQAVPQTPAPSPSAPAATPAVAPTNYPTDSYKPPTGKVNTGGRLLVWSEHPYIGPWGELDIDARGVTPNGVVTLTIYAPDGKVAVQLQRFGEWDADADWDLHASGWAPGQYRAVVKDIASGLEGETIVTIGAGSQYYYDDD